MLSALRSSSLAVAFVLAVAENAMWLSTTSASAMEVSARCRTADEIKTGMSSEGFFLAIIATDAKSNTARYFYYNPARHSAYLVFSDQPRGQKPTCGRVQSEWPQAQLLDIRHHEPSSDHHWSGTPESVAKECDALGWAKCGYYDDLIERYKAKNLATYLRGVTPQQSADGKATGDVIVSVLGSVNTDTTSTPAQAGKIIDTFGSGMTAESFDYSFVGYTDAAVKLLDQR